MSLVVIGRPGEAPSTCPLLTPRADIAVPHEFERKPGFAKLRVIQTGGRPPLQISRQTFPGRPESFLEQSQEPFHCSVNILVLAQDMSRFEALFLQRSEL
jgi:hypothetical protein